MTTVIDSPTDFESSLPESRQAQRSPRLLELCAEILAKNQRVNLTAARELEPLWGAHIADALALAERLRPQPPAALIDVGTGGGLPGLVLAMELPTTQVALLDATRKKVQAVAEIAVACGLTNVETIWARVEDWGRGPGKARFDVVTVRAVADIRTLLGYVGPLLRRGGIAWLFKSVQAVEAESAAAAEAARTAGLRLARIERYALPAGFGERAFAVYEKLGAKPV